jgi:hypothetical protein
VSSWRPSRRSPPLSSRRAPTAAGSFSSCWAGGWSLLFFGYVENYAPLPGRGDGVRIAERGAARDGKGT